MGRKKTVAVYIADEAIYTALAGTADDLSFPTARPLIWTRHY